MNRTTNRDSWMDMTNGLTVTREKGRGGIRENKMLKKLKINKLKKKKNFSTRFWSSSKNKDPLY